MNLKHPKWNDKSSTELRKIQANIERAIADSCYPKSIELVTRLLEDIREKIREVEKEEEWKQYLEC